MNDGEPPGKLPLQFLGFGVMYDTLNMVFVFNGPSPLSDMRIRLYEAAAVMYT